MSRLYRVANDGRCLGFIVQDRPIDSYAPRSDLTTLIPPDAPIGYSAYLVNGSWVLQLDPTPAAAASPAPRLWKPWED